MTLAGDNRGLYKAPGLHEEKPDTLKFGIHPASVNFPQIHVVSLLKDVFFDIIM